MRFNFNKWQFIIQKAGGYYGLTLNFLCSVFTKTYWH